MSFVLRNFTSNKPASTLTLKYAQVTKFNDYLNVCLILKNTVRRILRCFILYRLLRKVNKKPTLFYASLAFFYSRILSYKHLAIVNSDRNQIQKVAKWNLARTFSYLVSSSTLFMRTMFHLQHIICFLLWLKSKFLDLFRLTSFLRYSHY